MRCPRPSPKRTTHTGSPQHAAQRQDGGHRQRRHRQRRRIRHRQRLAQLAHGRLHRRLGPEPDGRHREHLHVPGHEHPQRRGCGPGTIRGRDHREAAALPLAHGAGGQQPGLPHPGGTGGRTPPADARTDRGVGVPAGQPAQPEQRRAPTSGHPGRPQLGGARYWLEEIDLQGKSTLHGPFTARQAPPESDLVARTSPPLLSDLGQGLSLAQADPATNRNFNFLPRRPLRPTTGEPSSWTVPGGPAVKIMVKQDGLYRIGQPDLLAAGLDPGGDPRRLRLYTDGREVAVRINGGSGRAAGRRRRSGVLRGGAGHGTHADTRVLLAGGYRSRPGPAGEGDHEPAPGQVCTEATAFPFTIEQKEKVRRFRGAAQRRRREFLRPPSSRRARSRARCRCITWTSAATTAELQLVAAGGKARCTHRVQDPSERAAAGGRSNGRTGTCTRAVIQGARRPARGWSRGTTPSALFTDGRKRRSPC